MPSIQCAPEAGSEAMARIPGGTFLMGSDRFYNEEKPAHQTTVGAF